MNAQLARVRMQKESAIDEQDFERAARLREEEKRLLADRGEAEAAWLAAGDIPEAGLASGEGPGAGDEPGDEAPGAGDEPGDEAPGAASGR
ncbi:MAG TPA: UvrB/UvrC motif-containing protein [Streptosporangiaceae bacterium]|nr:UvrB/UvrC motif-containing protein [Streptosporangiaceae bacterium]